MKIIIIIGLIKDELGEKIKSEFAAWRPKTYSCLTDNSGIKKKNQLNLKKNNRFRKK